MKDQFWEGVDKLPLSSSPPFESIEEEDHNNFLAMFDDNP